MLVVGNEMESVPDRSYMMLIDLMQLSTQQPLSSNRVFQFCNLQSQMFSPSFSFHRGYRRQTFIYQCRFFACDEVVLANVRYVCSLFLKVGL